MPKIRMNRPAQPPVHTKRYTSFKGVDFSSDPTQVDDSRSPRAVNVYPDATGCPKKRPGWAALLYSSDTGNDSIRGIYRFKTTEEKDAENNVKTPAMDVLVIHAGNSLYSIDAIYDVTDIPAPGEGTRNPYVTLSDYGNSTSDYGNSTLLMSGLTGEKSTGFMHKNKLHVLTGKDFIIINAVKDNDKWTLKAGFAEDIGNAYSPLTRINCPFVLIGDPVNDGEKTSFDAATPGELVGMANIVTPYRKNEYTIEATTLGSGTKNYVWLKLEGDVPLDPSAEKDEKNNLGAMRIKINSERGTIISCTEQRDIGNTGVPQQVFAFTGKASGSYIRNGLRINGNAFYHLLQEKNELSKTDSENTNVKVTFTLEYPIDPPKEKPDLYTRISSCSIADWYNNRLFLSGNPTYPNADFYSQVNEPTYIPDINYTEIGSGDSRIVGYIGVGNQQAVLKSDSIQMQDSSVYLRRAEWDEEEGYYYPLQSGIIGTGAVAEKAITSFVDDAVYLTKDGVMGLVTENITGERVLSQRSTRINKRLLAEPNLENAIMHIWNGYLFIAINGHIYLADSRQRTYARNSTNTFEYEWYYWDDICFIRNADRQLEADEITCFAEYNGTLYFGTKKGNICTFRDGDRKFMDLSPFGVSRQRVEKYVTAEWSTKLDDDGSFTLQKNLCKRGCGIFLKGVKSGKIKIFVRTDKDFDSDLELVDKDLAARSWSELNFEEFSFDNTSFKTKTCMVAAPNRRVKKYAALQIICRSDTATDFALMGIEKRYTTGRFEK